MKFEVYKDGKLMKDFVLCGAYQFGTDGISIRRSQILCNEGVIDCRKSSLETSGLCLLWKVNGFGTVMLPTTCLPERDKPYILNVELARAKLMQIINKREDWSFFDEVETVEENYRKARGRFIEAMQNLSDPPLASRLADEALKDAIIFSEQLCCRQSNASLDTRIKNKRFGRGCLCCSLDPSLIVSEQYTEKLLELFNFVTIPINWAQIEPVRGKYDFSAIDTCIKAVGRRKVAIGAGPLLKFSKENIPTWLLTGKLSFEKIRESAYEFIQEIVNTYANVIRAWQVVSGLNVYNCFAFNFEQVLEITRAANMAVKAASDRAIKIIVISNPWGEYYSAVANTIPPLVYVDMIMQSGISFDAFGLQIQLGRDASGMYMRDLMHISSILDNFSGISKPLYISDVEIPGSNGSSSGGLWHKKWDHKLQALWLEQFSKIALSKSSVDTVTYSHLADKDGSVMPQSGLLTGDLKNKEAFLALKKIREVIFSR